MSPRILAGVLGAITIAMGVAALASPERTMAFVGFAALTPTEPVLAHCETRAVYGGLFTVLGAFTLWGALDPTGRRSVLFMTALLWLGLCAGRAFGISVDGSPGIMGWAALAWEGGFGLAILWAALSKGPVTVAANPQVQ